MKRSVTFLAAVGLVLLVACSAKAVTNSEELVSSVNPVTTPDGDEVGESELTRATNKIELTLNACCVIPGNAYTAWWLIGDVTKPMHSVAVKAKWAAGFVASSEQIILKLELEAGSGRIRNTHNGIRIVVLDHGPDSGSRTQLSESGAGCESDTCPTVLETAHPAP